MTQQVSTYDAVNISELLMDFQRRLEATEQHDQANQRSNLALQEQVGELQQHIAYLNERSMGQENDIRRLNDSNSRQEREIKHLKENTIGGHINHACAKVEEVASDLVERAKEMRHTKQWNQFEGSMKVIGLGTGAIVGAGAFVGGMIAIPMIDVALIPVAFGVPAAIGVGGGALSAGTSLGVAAGFAEQIGDQLKGVDIHSEEYQEQKRQEHAEREEERINTEMQRLGTTDRDYAIRSLADRSRAALNRRREDHWDHDHTRRV